MPTFVGKIEIGQTLDATDYFDGPWKSFARIAVQPGATHTFTGDTAEFAIFVMSGSGNYVFSGVSTEVTPGSAITVGLGSEITVSADAGNTLELFVTTLSVPPA